jgi:hypothetical protein
VAYSIYETKTLKQKHLEEVKQILRDISWLEKLNDSFNDPKSAYNISVMKNNFLILRTKIENRNGL